MKTIVFSQTTTGYIGEVNGTITWLIRDEPRLVPNERWFVYKSENGGEGFKLIPAKCTRDENGQVLRAEHWGFDTLEKAKSFIYNEELN